MYCMLFSLYTYLGVEATISAGEVYLLLIYSCFFLFFYLLSLCETYPSPQLPCAIHVEAECQTRGQGLVQQNDLHPLYQTAAG